MQMFVFNKLLFDRFLKNQIISRILLIKHFSRIFSVSNFRCELSTPGKKISPLRVIRLGKGTQKLDGFMRKDFSD